MTEKSNALALAQLLMLHADTIENDSIKNMVIDSATELAVLHDEIERLKAALGYDWDAENKRLREENRLWYSRAVALFWRGDSDNITVGRLQLAAKEIDAALKEVPR